MRILIPVGEVMLRGEECGYWFLYGGKSKG